MISLGRCFLIFADRKRIRERWRYWSRWEGRHPGDGSRRCGWCWYGGRFTQPGPPSSSVSCWTFLHVRVLCLLELWFHNTISLHSSCSWQLGVKTRTVDSKPGILNWAVKCNPKPRLDWDGARLYMAYRMPYCHSSGQLEECSYNI